MLLNLAGKKSRFLLDVCKGKDRTMFRKFEGVYRHFMNFFDEYDQENEIFIYEFDMYNLVKVSYGVFVYILLI